jgi:hypothetical protein
MAVPSYWCCPSPASTPVPNRHRSSRPLPSRCGAAGDVAPEPRSGLMSMLEELRQAVKQDFPAAVEELSALVSIPAMAWDAFDPGELNRAAAQVAALVRESGLADVAILQAPRAGRQAWCAGGGWTAAGTARQAHHPALCPLRRPARRDLAFWQRPAVRGRGTQRPAVGQGSGGQQSRRSPACGGSACRAARAGVRAGRGRDGVH